MRPHRDKFHRVWVNRARCDQRAALRIEEPAAGQVPVRRSVTWLAPPVTTF
jgi:hypothetical protein